VDLPALQTALSAKEQALDSVESRLFIATFRVVVGLVLEYWHPIAEFIVSYRKRPPFPWKKLQEIIGGVLITAGVFGELAFQHRASHIETDIRSTSHQVEGLLNAQAEHERTARLDLEEDIPLGFWNSRRLTSSERLRSFVGTKFAIKVVDGPDLETREPLARLL
jgi:hypothetical protein